MQIIKQVNSNSFNSGINWVCSSCGRRACKETYGKNKKPFEVSTYHVAKCDCCGRYKPVTEVRDFHYPIFSIRRKDNGGSGGSGNGTINNGTDKRVNKGKKKKESNSKGKERKGYHEEAISEEVL